MMNKVSGAKAAITAFTKATKGETVSEEEVRFRMGVCSKCPKRRLVRGVGRVSAILGNLANKHRVPREVSQYACGVCGCSLMLLLPAKPDDLHKDSEEEAKQRPKKCWIPVDRSASDQ